MLLTGSPVPNISSLKEGSGGQYQRVAGIYFSKTRTEAEKYTKVQGIKHPENIIEAQVQIDNPAHREILDQLGYELNGLGMQLSRHFSK
jgi:hypothetical protein